jgi:quercetin dioxygenase-like cupin family protein
MPATALQRSPEVRPARDDAYWFIASLMTVKLSGEDTDGRLAVLDMTGPAGDMPPLHVHHADDEVFMIDEGEVTLYVGDRVVRGGPGSVVFAPRGVAHTYRIESETARFRVIASPAGFEQFAMAVSVPAEAPTLPPAPAVDPQRLAEVAARHAIEILGPPGALPTR